MNAATSTNSAPAERARIGGWQPFSACDWPGKLVAVVFLAGCPWRCGYCHNPGLLQRRHGQTSWPQLRAQLQARRGLLDGVVFSGGEPLSEPALPALLAEVRAMGFATGLHSGGSHPQRLAAVLPLFDPGRFPSGCRTVGDLAEKAAGLNYAKLRGDGAAAGSGEFSACAMPPRIIGSQHQHNAFKAVDTNQPLQCVL